MAGSEILVASLTKGRCPHLGSISASAAGSKVKAGGQAVVVVTDTFSISGCQFKIPVPGGTKPQPCVTGMWLQPATRVFVDNQPVVLKSSSGLCRSAEQIPQGPPSVTSTQTRVKAQ